MKQGINFYCIVTTLLVITLSSCTNASKLYKKGDYYKATIEAVKKLRTKPDDLKSQEVLLQAYPLAQETALRFISNATLGNNPDKYDILVAQYSRLNELADQIFRCPKAYELVPYPQEYIAELGEAKESAAKNAYNLGVKALNAGTIDQARKAYDYFTRVNNYIHGYLDVLEKLEDALYYSTLRVLVERPITNQKYQLSTDFFYDQLVLEMNKQKGKRMIRYYTQEEALAEKMKNPHHYIVLNFEDFTIGNIKESLNSVEVKRDSVLVGTVVVDGKTHNAYNTVKATLITTKREVISGGVLSLLIIEASTNKNLQKQNFSGSYVWKTSWATFKGDDRALTNEQKRLCTLQPGIQPPSQDLFVEFTKPIFNQVITYISTTYKRY